MKSSTHLLPLLALLQIFLHATCFAQGSLAPPGAPGATMKSLDQLEPRTPVDSVHTPGNISEQFIISQSGSYYLTTNIVGASNQNGIQITASNVTLDLAGFTVLGIPTSNNGILNQGENVVIRNGTIRGWRQIGIWDQVSSSVSRVFEGLTVCSNLNHGIQTAVGAVIRNCIIEGNGGFGIFGSGATRITGCVVNGNASAGIGLESPGGCVIDNNVAFGNNTADNFGDIYMNSGNNHVENNRVIVTSTNGFGIYVFSVSRNTNNVIIKNDVFGGGSRNFNIFPGNDVGPIGTATNSVSPWANISH